MTYDEWADEYLESARVTMEQIKKCRAECHACKNKRLLPLYQKRLRTLWEMREDLIRTADELRRKAARFRKAGYLKSGVVMAVY